MRLLNPDTIPAPVGAYSHVAVVESGRLAFVSGQVGVGADGKVPGDLAAEAQNVWTNVKGAVLGAGGSLASIAKVNVYVVAGADIAPIRAARIATLGDHKPASTLVVVSALAGPEYHYEVEVVAELG